MASAIRPATLRDAPMLAALHVRSWEETYRGLLPDQELAARPLDVRLLQWSDQIARGGSRIALAPGLGFAQMGRQRDTTPVTAAYPDELYCLYVLASAHGTGLGRALLRAVAGTEPFTALVVEGNDRACAFYEKVGGACLERRRERIGESEIIERVYGFPALRSLRAP